MIVYVAVLSSGWIRRELSQALIEISHDRRYGLEIHWPWDRPITSNRNGIVKKCLASGADWLLMVDSDVWPYRNPLDLVERDLDVVSFPVPIYRIGCPEPPIVMNITPLDGGKMVDMGQGDVVEVMRGGGSMMLIARRVLEHQSMRAPFQFTFDEDGIKIADEDVIFFDRARAIGFQVWTALSHPCGHIKEVDLVDMHSAVAEWR